MIAGQTRNYILGMAAMLIISVWSPNKLAYTEPPVQCGDMVDNSLVFNSTILKLSAQYDSAERAITTKAAIVDSQSRLIVRNLKKLTNDNNKQVVVNSGRRIVDTTNVLTLEELQKLPKQYYHHHWTIQY